jgi:hypothetical protein
MENKKKKMKRRTHIQTESGIVYERKIYRKKVKRECKRNRGKERDRKRQIK